MPKIVSQGVFGEELCIGRIGPKFPGKCDVNRGQKPGGFGLGRGPGDRGSQGVAKVGVAVGFVDRQPAWGRAVPVNPVEPGGRRVEVENEVGGAVWGVWLDVKFLHGQGSRSDPNLAEFIRAVGFVGEVLFKKLKLV